MDNNRKINKMRVLGRIAHEILFTLERTVKSGNLETTKDIETVFNCLLDEYFVESSVLGYRGFPSTLCVSINNEIIHGIPKDSKKIKEGDLIEIDIAITDGEFHVDTAKTFVIGKPTYRQEKLINTGQLALERVVLELKDGFTVNNVTKIINDTIKYFGLVPVPIYGGHGIGEKLQELPFIPNIRSDIRDFILKEGMTICIEPTIMEKGNGITTAKDGWTVLPIEDCLSSHYEHTILITKNGCEILT